MRFCSFKADFYRLFRSKVWITGHSGSLTSCLESSLELPARRRHADQCPKQPAGRALSLDQLLFQHQCDYPLYHYCVTLVLGTDLTQTYTKIAAVAFSAPATALKTLLS